MTILANSIEITVDKSHIVTIGERLYSESIELIRELVNNAYDADASEVHVFISDEHIIIEDNGLGMDLKGLKQYFNIGSQFKKGARKSPKFERDRIGEFGIGKFASLSACSTFELWTKKDDFQAKVTFDKEVWNKSGSLWHIPLEIEEPNSHHENGTKITLRQLTKKFNISRQQHGCPYPGEPGFSPENNVLNPGTRQEQPYGIHWHRMQNRRKSGRESGRGQSGRWGSG